MEDKIGMITTYTYDLSGWKRGQKRPIAETSGSVDHTRIREGEDTAGKLSAPIDALGNIVTYTYYLGKDTGENQTP